MEGHMGELTYQDRVVSSGKYDTPDIPRGKIASGTDMD